MKLHILLVLSSIGALQASMTTTHKPREPNEYEQLLFFYNRNTHHLLLKESNRMTVNCYVHKLTAMQMAHVHSDFGLKNIELYMLGHQPSATKVSMSMFDESDANWCKHGSGNRTIAFFRV